MLNSHLKSTLSFPRAAHGGRYMFVKFFIVLALSILTQGCVSHSLPPVLKESNFHINKPLIISSRNPKSLALTISSANVFSKVIISNTSSNTDFVAKSNKKGRGSSVIPGITAITLGIIPTITSESFGESFTITHGNKTYNINAIWRQNTVLGWVSYLLNILPSRTKSIPTNSKEYINFVKRKIQFELSNSKQSQYYNNHKRELRRSRRN